MQTKYARRLLSHFLDGPLGPNLEQGLQNHFNSQDDTSAACVENLCHIVHQLLRARALVLAPGNIERTRG